MEAGRRYGHAFTQLENLSKLARMGRPMSRPLCDLFKPLLLQAAMEKGSDGDIVMWVDSRQYNLTLPAQLLPDIHAAYNQLVRLGSPHWAFVMACHHKCDQACMANGAFNLFTRDTLLGYSSMIPTNASFATRPHVLATNLLLANNPTTRELIATWLKMGLDQPRAFCDSHAQDQPAWTILITNQSLPLLDLCSDLFPPAADLHAKRGCKFLSTHLAASTSRTRSHLSFKLSSTPQQVAEFKACPSCHEITKSFLVLLDMLQRGQASVRSAAHGITKIKCPLGTYESQTKALDRWVLERTTTTANLINTPGLLPK